MSLRAWLAALVAALAAAVWLGSAARSAARPTGTVVLLGGNLIDVRHGAILRNSVVILAGGRVHSVGCRGQVVIPKGARTIDLSNRWLIPGLIDMHTHGAADPGAPLAAYLRAGITSIRDLGGNASDLLHVRELMQQGRIRSPRIFYSGLPVDGWAARLGPRLLLTEPRGATELVDHLAGGGASLVKFYDHIPVPALAAVVRAAHSRRLPITGHTPRSAGIETTIGLGVDGLEHIRLTREDLGEQWLAGSEDLPPAEREARVWSSLDPASPRLTRIIEAMAKSRVLLTPTLAVEEAMAGLGPGGLWPESAAPAGPAFREIAATGFRKRLDFVGRCCRAGVRVMAGTDSRAPTVSSGLTRELELLVRSACAPLEVLRSATSAAADGLGAPDLGAIEPGRLADIVALDANPLESIVNTRRVHMVIQGGEVMLPVALQNDRRREN